MPKKKVDSYYPDYEEEVPDGGQTSGELPVKKIITAAVILLVIIIAVVLLLNLLGQKNNALLYGPDGNAIGGKVTVSTDGRLVSDESSSGGNLHLAGNPNEKKNFTIKTSSKFNIGPNSVINSVTIRTPGGFVVLHSGQDFFVDENGNIHLTIDPANDLNIDAYFDENTGEYVYDSNIPLDFGIEIAVDNPDTGETTIIDINGDFLFQEFAGEGCIALNRTSVAETTHYGTYELDAKLRVTCDVGMPVTAFVLWNSERMGNIEVSGSQLIPSVLTGQAVTIMPSPSPDEYDLKIIFTPLKEFAGQTASFSANFAMGQGKARTDFQLALDNLEQCVRLSPDKVVIPAGEDSASLNVDASSCASSQIEFSLCDKDNGCAGGSEGGIGLGETSFAITPKKSGSKNITIRRGDIPGAYGLTVYAKVAGASKTLIDDKLVLVEPKKEDNIVPDKFVVSFIGQGTADSINVHNYSLAEDVPVQASICNVYKSSLGVKGDTTNLGSGAIGWGGSQVNSWWQSMLTDPAKQSGQGKYQLALYSVLPTMENMRAEIQPLSAQQNSLIKKAYLAVVETRKSVYKLVDSSQGMADAVSKLEAAAKKNNDFKNGDAAATYSQLLLNATTFASSSTVACTTSTVASDTANTEAGTMNSCKAGASPANWSAGDATAAATISCTEFAVQGKNVFDQVSNQLNPTMADLHPEESVAQAKEYLRLVSDAKEHVDNEYDYAQKALAAAAINSFVSTSQNDADAKKYLDLATQENGVVAVDLGQAQTAINNANNAITALGQAEKDIMTQVQQYASTATQLTDLVAQTISKGSTTTTLLNKSGASMQASAVAAAGSCSACPEGGQCSCCGLAPPASAVADDLTAAGQTVAGAGLISAKVSASLNLALTGYQTWRALDTDFVLALLGATEAYQKTFDDLGNASADAEKTKQYLSAGSDAAGWLSAQESASSSASQYVDSLGLDGSFNKARLTGLIGSSISNAFINGAFEGGVYSTTAPADWSFATNGSSSAANNAPSKSKISFDGVQEGCDNMISLTLPDYAINLPRDGKAVNVSVDGVAASWIKGSEKVFDVFNEQEMSVRLSNNGLRQNSYGTIEFQVDRHVHANPTTGAFDFAPFNLPDDHVETESHKYHFRFEVAPRAGNNFSPAASDCSAGLARGETGSDALPKVLMAWDWNSVKGVEETKDSNISLFSAAVGTGSSKEPFLDSTQLSILLSKKLGALNSLLSSVNPTCPENQAKTVFDKLRPGIIDPRTGQAFTGYDQKLASNDYCYLPLTTRPLDGEPALYYFLEGQQLSAAKNSPSDAESVKSVDDLSKLIDFNVNLTRDGYGTDFQYDFVDNYSRSILNAGPSFLDPDVGAKKYFINADRAYFTSQARPNPSSNERKWALPDAGKYEVRMLIDFKGGTNIFTNGSPSAKIAFDLYSLEPVYSNYSPWYYLPIDGSVGLSASNSRAGYGTGLSGPGSLDVSNRGAAYLDVSQNLALSHAAYSRASDFSLLNALPSMRSKLLDVAYSFNTATSSDSNSKIIFSPTVATPLIFELNGVKDQNTVFVYSAKNGSNDIPIRTNNIFLLSGVEGCSDLSGNLLTDSFNHSPDECNYSACGVLLPPATQSGKTYLETVAYSPVDSSYGIKKPSNGDIFSGDSTSSIPGLAPLFGAQGMAYNDLSASSVIRSLSDAYSSVAAKSACVASMGNREVVYWPEDNLFSQNAAGNNFAAAKENFAKSNCVKAE